MKSRWVTRLVVGKDVEHERGERLRRTEVERDGCVRVVNPATTTRRRRGRHRRRRRSYTTAPASRPNSRWIACPRHHGGREVRGAELGPERIRERRPWCDPAVLKLKSPPAGSRNCGREHLTVGLPTPRGPMGRY